MAAVQAGAHAHPPSLVAGLDSLLPLPAHKVSIPGWQAVAAATISPVIACVFTNPFDVAKVKLQLQGERARAGAPKTYTGTLDLFRKTYSAEGIRGLQRGLTVAFMREASKNLFRLGAYGPVLGLLHNKEDGPIPFYKRFLGGMITGPMGALACNPTEVIKARMQSQTSSAALATGHQHGYTGVWNAFSSVYRKEGFAAFYRGTSASACRSMLGSATNLSVMYALKDYVQTQGYKDSLWLDLGCSLISSFMSTITMNPCDVVRVRMYNQPSDANGKGKLYSSMWDCIVKITRNEGLGAFYSGFFAHYMRWGPHCVLVFLILGSMTRRLSARAERQSAEERWAAAFAACDTDNDGTINRSEVKALLQEAFPYSDGHDADSWGAVLDEAAEEVMRRADLDGSGDIDQSEFARAGEHIERLVRTAQARRVFAQMDLNGDGTIDASELAAAMAKADKLQSSDGMQAAAAHLIQDVHDGATGSNMSFDDFSRLLQDLQVVEYGKAVSMVVQRAGATHD